MIRAEYSVIRYNADPGRDEWLNIGIVLWDHQGFQVRIQGDAINRVIRDNPHLERDALLHLESQIQAELEGHDSYDPDNLVEQLKEQPGFPVAFTEPRPTLLDTDTAQAFQKELDWLVGRIVQTKRRFGGSPQNVAMVMERKLGAYIARNVVQRHHPFATSRSGLRHTAEFYLNSSTNVAVDILGLAVQQAEIIRQRAWATAFKVNDVQTANDYIRYYVVCQFSEQAQLAEVNRNARLAIESTGATILTDVDEAVHVIESKALPLLGQDFA